MATNAGFGSFGHLASRFFGALDPRGPAPAEEQWALGWLVPGEQRLWRRMSGPDRRHAAGVAHDVARLLGDPSPPREVMASALLHDVGKVESGLGTFARVGVTVAAIALGRDRLLLRSGDDRGRPGDDRGRSGDDRGRRRLSRWRRQVSDYLTHDRIGAALLEEAGADPMTVAWAGEHHRPAEEWTVDRRLADALKAADGD